MHMFYDCQCMMKSFTRDLRLGSTGSYSQLQYGSGAVEEVHWPSMLR